MEDAPDPVKFLKAVRLDASDSQVYSREGAARDGEWLVSGGYAVCDPTGVTHRAPNCHCLTSFIGVVSRGRCTIAEVVEIDKSEYQQVIERLVRHFMDDLGAPTLEAARAVAEEEAAYTAELCESFSSEVWITVKRTLGDDPHQGTLLGVQAADDRGATNFDPAPVHPVMFQNHSLLAQQLGQRILDRSLPNNAIATHGGGLLSLLKRWSRQPHFSSVRRRPQLGLIDKIRL